MNRLVEETGPTPRHTGLRADSSDVIPSGYQASPLRDNPQISLLEEYLRAFRRHRWLILTCACTGLLLLLLVSLPSQPRYRTRTSLEIRNLNGDFMDMRAVAPTGSNSAADSDTNLQTQIKLLQSDSLIHEVSSHMLVKPVTQSIPRSDALSRIARALHVFDTPPLSYKAMVDDAASNVKVKPLGLTRLVEITCDSYDAQFSATFCNTLTKTFEEEDLHARASEAERTSEWLTQQAADIRQRAEDSQRKLERAVGGNGLMLSQTTTTAGEDRMRSLQEELVKAQADRMQQEAIASASSASDPYSIRSVQENPEHRNYEMKLADLRSQVAALVPALTEQNPKVMHLRSQIVESERGLVATEMSSTKMQSNELNAARHREHLLQVAFNMQETMVSSDLQKGAQVSLLRRELESEQQLYQTLLQRAKEAGFASAMQAATIRVVDPAEASKTAFSPRRTLSAAGGLIFGSLFGVGFALYRERNNKVFRSPGEVPRFLHLQELGVIPATKVLNSKTSGLVGVSEKRKWLALDSTKREGEAVSLTRWDDRFSIVAEAYRNATFSILLADANKRARTYVVSSPNAAEGKTTVTANLGIALSKSRMRVVLIDGDLRRPALHRAFGLENQFGLREILRGEVDLETTPLDLLTRKTSLPNVSIIPAGIGNEEVVELLHSRYFGALLARLSRDFDVILIDTAPVLHMADARILASQSDGGILVLRAGLTHREEAEDACHLFDRDGVRLIGTILNDFDPRHSDKGNYYSSYHRYQNVEQTEIGGGR